jgi:uncharacterized flavoprotein (TIGR03862 family)
MTELAPNVTIIGAGPAGLMAAEILSDAGYAVSLYEAMPSPARKFLMAGKSGLNITNRREGENLSSRYPGVAPLLKNTLSEFGPASIAEWMQGLGVEATIGPTGRVFPVQMKASPLLRAWQARLQSQGVQLYTRHRWTRWSDNADLIFDTPEGPISVQSDAQIFALGGGSWKRLGSDGNWSSVFAERGVQTEPFRPSNCGFTVDWSDRMKTEFVGTPVKNVAVRFGDQTSREEFVMTDRGVESGAIFTLSLAIRDRLETDGEALLEIDLAPDLAEETLVSRLTQERGKQSLSNHLRKAANLKGVKRALLFEFGGLEVSNDPVRLARLIKCLPIPLGKPFPLDEAISTAGGVSFDALDGHFMVKQQPGMFCAGEMLDWDAPTGGYLLTACMATGRAAGLGAVRWLKSQVS